MNVAKNVDAIRFDLRLASGSLLELFLPNAKFQSSIRLSIVQCPLKNEPTLSLYIFMTTFRPIFVVGKWIKISGEGSESIQSMFT